MPKMLAVPAASTPDQAHDAQAVHTALRAADPGAAPLAPAAGSLPIALAGALLERLPEPVLLLATTGRLIAANRAAAALLGIGGPAAGSADAGATPLAAGVDAASGDDPSGLLDFGPAGVPTVAAPVPPEAVAAAVVAYASGSPAAPRRVEARIRHGEQAGSRVVATIEPLAGVDGKPLAALLRFERAADAADESIRAGDAAAAFPATATAATGAPGRAAGAGAKGVDGVDPLTGLPRRAEAERWLARAVERARLEGGVLVVLRARLSALGSVRGLHGRAGADEVVRTVSQRLGTALRGDDLIARLDADEFVVAAAVRVEEDAVPVAAKVERALGAPIRVDHGVASVRPCVGAAIWPRDGDTHDALLARAALVGKLSGR